MNLGTGSPVGGDSPSVPETNEGFFMVVVLSMNLLKATVRIPPSQPNILSCASAR
jgi:hypothetical protein